MSTEVSGEVLGQGFCYETRDLIAACEKDPTNLDDFLFRSFFNPSPLFVEKYAALSKIVKGKVLAAPFSNACAPGVIMSSVGNHREIKDFEPPNIHIKDMITPCDADDPYLRTRDDGSYEPSIQRRWSMAQDMMVVGQRNSVTQTEYNMMVSAMVYGQIKVSGVGIKTQTLCYGRPEDHTIGSPEELGFDACDPCSDLDGLFEAITEKLMCYGANGPYDVIFDEWACRAIQMHPKFTNWFEFCCPGYTVPRGAFADRSPQRYQSTKLLAENDDFRFWKHTGKICEQDENGKPVIDEDTGEPKMLPVMPEGSMLIFDREAINARRVFGEIQEISAEGGLVQRRTEIWPKVVVDQECETYSMHSRSRPLPVIGCAGASALVYIATAEGVKAKKDCDDVLEVTKTVEATPAKAATKAADTATKS